MDGLGQPNTPSNTNGNPQQQQQQPMGADALNAAAVQQAIAAFQASVEQAASVNNHHNPIYVTQPQHQVLLPSTNGMVFPTPTPTPAAPALPNPLIMTNATQNPQQLWQQAWLSALLPAPQAALTQPYLAAALNPLQPQQLQLPQQLPLPQQLHVQTQQPQGSIAQLPAKRKAPGFTSTTKKSESRLQRQDRKQASTVVSSDYTLEKPPVPKTDAELMLMSQSERRRYERNLREQQRSYKISQQIKQLRDVLEESNIPFRPNKYSILVNVAEYIKQLQSRAIMLDSEHQRLIDTIKYTTEKSLSPNIIIHNTQPALESDAPLVQGIDYKSVFLNARFPLGVATLDGRVLACNRQMERLLQTTSDSSLVDQSFFVFIRNHQEIFEAMADLLKRSTATIETGEGTIVKSSRLLFWCGHILSSTNQTFPFAITLTNDANDNPKFFSLSAAIPPPPVT